MATARIPPTGLFVVVLLSVGLKMLTIDLAVMIKVIFVADRRATVEPDIVVRVRVAGGPEVVLGTGGTQGT